MEKHKIIRYGTIALILFFAFEYLWPLLYAPQAEATPTPTPGAGNLNIESINATARVLKLAPRLVLLCNDANATAQAKQKLSGIQGVERILQGNGILDVGFTQNASETAMLEASLAFYESCGGGIAFRKTTQLEFASAITVNDSLGRPQTLRLPSTLCSQALWNCMVFATTGENSTVKTTVSIKQNAQGYEEGYVQQIADSANATASPQANATTQNNTASNATGNTTGNTTGGNNSATGNPTTNAGSNNTNTTN